jgi:hypothetical protein
MEELAVALGAARAALMQGDKTTARAELATVLRADPGNAQAWLLMSGIVTTPEQQRDCLARVLAIEPDNPAARRGLAALEAAPATLATSGAPASAPSGIRRLAAAPSPEPPHPALAPLAYAAAEPGWTQPAAPVGGMRPSFDLPAPQYEPATAGVVPSTYPAASPRRSQRPLVLVTIGLFVFAFTLFSLRMVRNANTASPPPTPKISAQDRTVGFINSFLGYYSNPLFYNADTVDDLIRPTAEQYLVPDYAEAFLSRFEANLRRNPVDPALVGRVREIKQAYFADPRFTVVEQTPSAITLEVVGGEMWVVMHDGQAVNQPMFYGFRRVELENIAGVWYIRHIDIDE